MLHCGSQVAVCWEGGSSLTKQETLLHLATMKVPL